MIYVRKVATRATTIVAWCSLTFIIGFWTWHVASNGIWPDTMGKEPIAEQPVPKEPPGKMEGKPETKTHEVWLQVDGMSKRLNIT